jgi:hypothetical protein
MKNESLKERKYENERGEKRKKGEGMLDIRPMLL